MSPTRIAALVAALVLIAGSALVPVVSLPFARTATLLDWARTPAVLLMVIAAVLIASVVLRRDRVVPVLGAGALYLIGRTGWRVGRTPDDADTGEALRDAVTSLAGGTHLAWGFWLLVVAAIAAVVTGIAMQQRRHL